MFFVIQLGYELKKGKGMDAKVHRPSNLPISDFRNQMNAKL